MQMPSRSNSLDLSTVMAEIEEQIKDFSHVKILGVDIDGIHRGKLLAKEKFLSSIRENTIESAIGFCGVIFGWDMHDLLYESESCSTKANENARQGYSDFLAKVDPFSLKLSAVEDGLPIILVDFHDSSSLLPLGFCPRSLLKASIRKLWEQVNADAICGIELEWYNYQETPDSLAAKKFTDLKPLTPGMFGYSAMRPSAQLSFFNDILNLTEATGIPIECYHTETGPGVYEVALDKCEALEAADRGQLFKTLTKQVAIKHNFTASFMAKPVAELPGCGGHIHLSLKDSDDNNLFAVSEVDGKQVLNENFANFIAGIIHCLPDLMPCFAPNINSYKRLDLRYWAPVLNVWGFDSRLAAIRVIHSTANPKATRLELRVPGSDMNIYLALAALIAAGTYGLENAGQLSLPDPLNETASSISANDPRLLPSSLETSIDRMDRKESLARTLLGDEFVNHFVMTRRHELRLFNSVVTDWERKRYFEHA